MNQNFRNRQLPAGSPLANILVVIAGIIVISLSLALGFVVFLGIAGFMLIMAAIMTVRVWWARRRFGAKVNAEPQSARPEPAKIRVIEGEFTEIRSTQEPKQRK